MKAKQATGALVGQLWLALARLLLSGMCLIDGAVELGIAHQNAMVGDWMPSPFGLESGGLELIAGLFLLVGFQSRIATVLLTVHYAVGLIFVKTITNADPLAVYPTWTVFGFAVTLVLMFGGGWASVDHWKPYLIHRLILRALSPAQAKANPPAAPRVEPSLMPAPPVVAVPESENAQVKDWSKQKTTAPMAKPPAPPLLNTPALTVESLDPSSDAPGDDSTTPGQPRAVDVPELADVLSVEPIPIPPLSAPPVAPPRPSASSKTPILPRPVAPAPRASAPAAPPPPKPSGPRANEKPEPIEFAQIVAIEPKK